MVEVREEGGKWKRESVKWSNCWKEFEVGDKLDALSEKNWYVCTVTKVWEDKIEVNFYEWGSRLTGLKNRKGSGPDGGNLEVHAIYFYCIFFMISFFPTFYYFTFFTCIFIRFTNLKYYF